MQGKKIQGREMQGKENECGERKCRERKGGFSLTEVMNCNNTVIDGYSGHLIGRMDTEGNSKPLSYLAEKQWIVQL